MTNWYIRRSRRRFWEDQDTQDRRDAFATLYYVLTELVKVAAPYVPFLSDAIYRNLRTAEMPDSVHLCSYPKYRADLRDETLEAEMAAVQTTVSLGHALRKEHKMKVRQPLATAHIASGDDRTIRFLKDQQNLIADELNVKEVKFSSDEKQFVHLRAKPNFRVLGKKVGKLMKAAQESIEKMDQRLLAQLMDGESVPVQIDGQEFVLNHEDVQVEREVREGLVAANEGKITIALDTNLTPALIREALAREVVNKINTMRREIGFEVTDRIHVKIEATKNVEECFKEYGDYICGEVLATKVDFGPNNGSEWDLNGELSKIELVKS